MSAALLEVALVLFASCFAIYFTFFKMTLAGKRLAKVTVFVNWTVSLAWVTRMPLSSPHLCLLLKSGSAFAMLAAAITVTLPVHHTAPNATESGRARRKSMPLRLVSWPSGKQGRRDIAGGMPDNTSEQNVHERNMQPEPVDQVYAVGDIVR